MEKILLLITLLILTSCATTPRPWTRTEKLMLVASCIAAGADAYTTIEGINNGCSETNVFISGQPSTGIVIAFTGILQVGFILKAHYWPDLRKWILGSKTFVNTGCAIRNANQY